MSQYYAVVRNDNYLEHHGIKGMKWGVRRFQRADGSRTAAGLKRYAEGAKSRIRSTVNRFKTDKKFRRRVALGAAAVGAAGLAAYGAYKYGHNPNFRMNVNRAGERARSAATRLKTRVRGSDAYVNTKDALRRGSNAVKSKASAAYSKARDSKYGRMARDYGARASTEAEYAFNNAKNKASSAYGNARNAASSAYKKTSKSVKKAMKKTGKKVYNSNLAINVRRAGEKVGSAATRLKTRARGSDAYVNTKDALRRGRSAASSAYQKARETKYGRMARDYGARIGTEMEYGYNNARNAVSSGVNYVTNRLRRRKRK